MDPTEADKLRMQNLLLRVNNLEISFIELKQELRYLRGEFKDHYKSINAHKL